MDDSLPIANACEFDGDLKRAPNLYRMWGGTESVYVWANSFDDAFEELVEWLDDHAPELYNLDEDALKEAAVDVGVAWRTDWPDWDDPDFEAVMESAESDLTVIGHTTLKHGTHIISHEWGGNDVDDNDEIEEVARRSLQECHSHDFLKGDRVYYSPPAEHLGPDETVEEYQGYYEVDAINGEDVEISNDEDTVYTSTEYLSHVEETDPDDPQNQGFMIRGAY